MLREKTNKYREEKVNTHDYRVSIKHSKNNRTFVDCMKEAIKTTVENSFI